MQNQDPAYVIGDWLIHIHYGVGQIVGIEEKQLEKKRRFFRVKAQENNGVYWIPVKQAAENDRVRPIAAQTRLNEALEILQLPPEVMDEEQKIRKEQIREARSAGEPLPIAKLIRDLTGRKAAKSLTMVEKSSLDYFKKRLISEWSPSLEIQPQVARQMLQNFLKISQSQTMGQTS
jgi:RNA polymerase-interacting CarD/CdnL/TRCF family regulator